MLCVLSRKKNPLTACEKKSQLYNNSKYFLAFQLLKVHVCWFFLILSFFLSLFVCCFLNFVLLLQWYIFKVLHVVFHYLNILHSITTYIYKWGGVILTLFVTTVLLSGLPLLNNQQKWIFNWHGYAWYCQLSSPKKVSFNWLRLIMVIMNVAQQINQNGLLNQCSRNKLSSRAIIRTRLYIYYQINKMWSL